MNQPAWGHTCLGDRPGWKPKTASHPRFAAETNVAGLDYGAMVSVNEVLAVCGVGVVESVTRNSSR
jgi:hypothetical protein